MKRLVAILLIGTFFLSLSQSVVSAEDVSTPKEVTEINSFELFWPVVAGKTIDDPLFLLKTLKENFRGILIFGKPQIADYAVLLATKRVVEAEKLINEGKNDFADKTLEQALIQLKKAEINLDKALAKKSSFQDEATDMVNKLTNLETFIPWLIAKSDKNKDALTKVLLEVNAAKAKLIAPK